MNGNFAASLAAVLVHEGGYVNDKRDPGGATNKGVTQRVYDDWRIGRKLTPRSVEYLSQPEVEAIYRERYWDKVRGDDLPSGVDYCAFDFAVNSGTNRASRFLQRAAGVIEDGQIGAVTLAAVKACPPARIIDAVCEDRLLFLRSLGTFRFFGKGWTKRVAEVRARARAMQ